MRVKLEVLRGERTECDVRAVPVLNEVNQSTAKLRALVEGCKRLWCSRKPMELATKI